jgi:molybdenum cofactor sulfurtransferase
VTSTTVHTTHTTTPDSGAAYAAFIQAYPGFTSTLFLDDLRRREYGRLDAQNQVYLDYTGGGLYAESQLRQHMDLLAHNVFGNPHSHTRPSQAMTDLSEEARAAVLAFFNASPDDYAVIFTPNASGAIKLVGEAYPFAPGGRYLLTSDNHNSVNGIREFARARGASFDYAPVVAPHMRLDRRRLADLLAAAHPGANNLFAFPAQSNYSGVQHPLEVIAQARERGWDVLVDAAAFAPTNRLDLSYWQPDFVPLSFYKMMGHPTGAGCLLARHTALAKLKRPWFAGGTITIASVLATSHYLAPPPASFEDGTINYLNLPAVTIGLRHLESIGIDAIHERVRCLTGWLLDSLRAMTHSNGQPVVRLHGPWELEQRGGTISGNYLDRYGRVIAARRIEEIANEAGIALRTGCFCNPGAGETALGLTEAEMKSLFAGDKAMSFAEMGAFVQEHYGKAASAVRVSLGLASTFADVQRFLAFVAGFIDKTVEEIGEPSPSHDAGVSQPDSA